MSWPLVLLDSNQWLEMKARFELQIGHCTYAPWVLESADWRSKNLGKNYWDIPLPRRLPILIKLPAGIIWCPDEKAWNMGQGYHGDGWIVRGTLPLVTISPSINYIGSYHGHVVEGVLTADCEGRKFA